MYTVRIVSTVSNVNIVLLTRTFTCYPDAVEWAEAYIRRHPLSELAWEIE